MMTRHKHAYVLNVMSADHPGIVAAVSNTVEGRTGNIDAASQTVLEGYFTLIMIVSFPEPINPNELAEEISSVNTSSFQVSVRKFETAQQTKPGPVPERFVITAFGKDREGIIRQFSAYLAGKDINIVDLYGNRQEDRFVLISQVEIPSQWEIALLQADLQELGRELGFTVRLQHENVFVATNQLRMTRLAE
ncbi:MAG: glycine cleavage system protein R [Phycisphaerae bacterium]